MHRKLMSKPWTQVFTDVPNVGFIDAFQPEFWAQEALITLESQLIYANMVNRSFEPYVANYGDTVHAHRPGAFKAIRKSDEQNVTVQVAVATTINVVMDQWLHASFTIKDGEETKGFPILREKYLVPAIRAIAAGIDQILAAQAYRFIGNSVGKLGVDPDEDTIIEARELAQRMNWPTDGRNFMATPHASSLFLKIEDFVNANTVGDDGTAMREGHLGRKFGFNFFESNNSLSIAAGSTVEMAAVANGSGYGAGATAIAYDGHSGVLPEGAWLTIAGDNTPQMITDETGGVITITPGLKHAVVDDAIITCYTPGAVDHTAGYDAGWFGDIVAKNFAVAPKNGQMVTFGTDYANRYGASGNLGTLSATNIPLDRLLKVGVSDDDAIGVGPAGEYNFIFHRDALTLVTRPLALPDPMLARSYVANFNGLSVRVTITYEGRAQGHLVTVDVLCGTAVLNPDLGIVMYA